MPDIGLTLSLIYCTHVAMHSDVTKVRDRLDSSHMGETDTGHTQYVFSLSHMYSCSSSEPTVVG